MKNRLLGGTAFLFAFALAVHARPQSPQGRGRGAVNLPDGAGKEQVEKYCTPCHQLNNIPTSGGYTRQGWHELISTMVALPKDQADLVVDYLAKHFPEQPRPKAIVIPGP